MPQARVTSGRSTSALILAGLAVLALALAGCGGDETGNGDETAAPGQEGAAGAQEEGGATSPRYGGVEAERADGKAARAEKVEIVEFSYRPDPVTIQAGGKVNWANTDPVAHTATADDGGFDTEVIDPGKRKSESFKQPGEYAYHCEIHPRMRGTVEVVESD